MTARAIRIVRVWRSIAGGIVDQLKLKPGVNVIVGRKDTGKTGWLHTISFLLGDTDSPEKALGEGIARKFDSASLTMVVGDEEVLLERRWKEHGAKHKIFINGTAIASAEFSAWIHERLNVPAVHFPKGNPYSGATWPELSWRMLFRHVHREERFWGDIADKQPEREQHACLLQFLGVADKLYPQELGEQIRLREELLRLRARKDQFHDVLQEAARGLVADPSVANVATVDAIDRATSRLKAEIEALRLEREQLLSVALGMKDAPSGIGARDAETQLAEARLRLQGEREQIQAQALAAEKRLGELKTYKDSVAAELKRIKRVEIAGDVFKPLSVTHCPHCDQRVKADGVAAGECFVCHQSLPAEVAAPWSRAKRRMEFEQEQLSEEESELTDLLRQAADELAEASSAARRIESEIAEIEVLLRPIRSKTAGLLPQGIASLDTKVGQLEERIAQLLRLRMTIDQRDQLSRQVDELAARVASVAASVDAMNADVQFESLSDRMSDGINDYLNQLVVEDPSRWVHKAVRFAIGERNFRLRVGEGSWTKVGATSQGFLILGYHYALLKLSGREDANYPGLALIDFPMTLADGESTASKENYLVEPYVGLARPDSSVQVIVCGRSFRGLKGVNRIFLRQPWVQGDHGDLEPVPDEDDIDASEGGEP